MNIVDIIAVSLSIIGTLIFSLWGNRQVSRLGTNVLYLLSNVMMIYSFSTRNMLPYVLLQSVFLVCSCIGIYKNRDAISETKLSEWFTKPAENPRNSTGNTVDCRICGAKGSVEFRKDISENLDIHLDSGIVAIELHGLEGYICKVCNARLYSDAAKTSRKMQIRAAILVYSPTSITDSGKTVDRLEY